MNDITACNIGPSHLIVGNITIDLKTGDVTGLSEDISEDAKFFWERVKEYIIEK